jgi:gamma-D-glutamyl-L-lysine dipeptidyl-peptidase
MQYGICKLSIVPLRFDSSDKSELVSQLLYGDFFKVLERQKKWSRIRNTFDSCEGWIDNKQYQLIDENQYNELTKFTPKLSIDLVEFIEDENQQLHPILLGSSLNALSVLNHSHDGNIVEGKKVKNNIIQTAFLYLNSPHLCGGKSPFGIDCSGFTQMVYKLNGYNLLREAYQQATQGEALSFIEESEPGDLAFFDDNEGKIVHVGLIMQDNYIIHVHGKVRIDRLDHTGIYNVDDKIHTHKLRVIKKVI